MKSIKFIIVTITISITVLIFAAQTGLGFYHFKSILSTQIESSLKTDVEKEAGFLNGKLDNVGKLARILAADLESLPQYNIELYEPIIKKYIQEEDLALGSGYWLEPFIYNEQTEYYGPYIYKDNGNLQLTLDYSNQEYNYFQYDWYKNALNSDKKLCWSEPYLDTVTNLTMMTISSSIKKDGRLIGATTVDVELKELQDYVSKIKVGQRGYAFIITSSGYYMAHRDESKNLKVKITEEKDPQVQAMGNTIINATVSGTTENSINNSKYMVSYAPIGQTGMKLVMVLPKEEATSVLAKFYTTNGISLLIALILFSVVLFLFINKVLTAPLKLIVLEAQRISGGDLTIDAQGKLNRLSLLKNEIGQLAEAFQVMSHNVREIVSQIIDKSNTLAASSQQLNANAQQTSAGANETAVTITKIASTVGTVSENSQEVSQQAGQVVDYANNGYQGIKSINKQMDIISSGSLQVNHSVVSTNNSINKINQFVEVIMKIADQTNLLALNAAIESARAGEAGKGFAVVADEVRKLAENTSQSTKEIQQLISEIAVESQNAVKAIEESEKEVRKGNEIVNEVGNSFTEIITAINNLNEQIKHIALSTEQLNSGVENVAATTEEQTAAIEEVSATSTQLSVIAEELTKLTNRFKI
ncbi:methyl-accepting chemotaxis sensory transducer [Desulforamulus reducens MI-1]|uniref:Methyl-accepting chemotaxis sensory transducer n=1 Tax=Desulforamulus reducens (strain ATCC BAA-1160 / DSM 100696 / MI-1) TaxID=349161 RepID=A4J1H9_DESRM|nr:methyl-accepting chemotaxis protein [Desulforamulus reducens]ABO48932.1 methyl-accepting chemotaxis sensory transducer [Desulforamulus reducens MI-1]